MTPKEKTKELVESFIDALTVKDCALIAVNEIIDEYQKIFPNVNRRNYWEEVKQEIELL